MAYDRCESLQGSSSRRRSKGRQSGYEPYKRGLNTKIHLAVDSSGMPVRAIITEGTRADCKEAIHLIEGIDAQNLLADRGYDTSEIVAFALSAGINVVIPPKKNRKEQREYDRCLYKIRHLVENAFLWLKRWRGIATRYAKKHVIVPFCCSYQVYSYLAGCFGLISCRHYLINSVIRSSGCTCSSIDYPPANESPYSS